MVWFATARSAPERRNRSAGFDERGTVASARPGREGGGAPRTPLRTRRRALESGGPSGRAARFRARPSHLQRPPREAALPFDRHHHYEAAVQGVEYDLDFIERVHRLRHGRPPVRIREDFCGTAALAVAWALRRRRNLAWGVDLDREVLEWAAEHRLARVPDHVRERVRLARRDVRRPRGPRVEVVVALNFSYWVFKRRADLLRYFESVRRSLAPGGLLVMNAFGGTEAMGPLVETSRIPAQQTVDGERLQGFTYVWEHESFNPVNHDFRCAIHFRLKNGRTMRRQFVYDWRFWTLAELNDVLLEAGFRGMDVYVEGWDERRHRPNGRHTLKREFETREGWLAYLVARA